MEMYEIGGPNVAPVLQITITKTPKGRYQVAWATRNGYGTIAADYRTVLGALLKGYLLWRDFVWRGAPQETER
jgi:hypothetical protein